MGSGRGLPARRRWLAHRTSDHHVRSSGSRSAAAASSFRSSRRTSPGNRLSKRPCSYRVLRLTRSSGVQYRYACCTRSLSAISIGRVTGLRQELDCNAIRLAPDASQPTKRLCEVNSCSTASPLTVELSALPPNNSCVKPATCTGSRRGCGFCVDVVSEPNNVSKAAARNVVRDVGRQITPSFGLQPASSSTKASSISSNARAHRQRQRRRRVEVRVAVDTDLRDSLPVGLRSIEGDPGNAIRVTESSSCCANHDAALDLGCPRPNECVARRGCSLGSSRRASKSIAVGERGNDVLGDQRTDQSVLPRELLLCTEPDRVRVFVEP